MMLTELFNQDDEVLRDLNYVYVMAWHGIIRGFTKQQLQVVP